MKTGSWSFNMAVAKPEVLFQHVGNIRHKIKRPSPISLPRNSGTVKDQRMRFGDVSQKWMFYKEQEKLSEYPYPFSNMAVVNRKNQKNLEPKQISEHSNGCTAVHKCKVYEVVQFNSSVSLPTKTDKVRHQLPVLLTIWGGAKPEIAITCERNRYRSGSVWYTWLYEVAQFNYVVTDNTKDQVPVLLTIWRS